jgi:pyruvate carboxylase
MPGKVSTVAVRRGQSVKAGERLVSIEAMKMETAIYSPRDSRVEEIYVEPGTVVESRDLLLTLDS